MAAITFLYYSLPKTLTSGVTPPRHTLASTMNHVEPTTSGAQSELASLGTDKHLNHTGAESVPLQSILVRCSTQSTPQTVYVETVPACPVRLASGSYTIGVGCAPSSSFCELDDEGAESSGASDQAKGEGTSDHNPEIVHTPKFELETPPPVIIVTLLTEEAAPSPCIRLDTRRLDGENWDLTAYHRKLTNATHARAAIEIAAGNHPLRMRIWQARALARKYKLPGGVPEEVPFVGATPRVPPLTPAFAPPSNRRVTFGSLPQRAMPLTRLIIPIDITPRPLGPVPSIVVTPPDEPEVEAAARAQPKAPDANFLDGDRFDFGLYWRTLCIPDKALDLRGLCERDRLVDRRVRHVFGLARKLGYPTPSFEESEQVWNGHKKECIAEMMLKKQEKRRKALEKPIARRHAYRSLYR